MELGYIILNVSVICDSACSGAVPVAASSLTGKTPRAVPVAASSSEGRGTGRLGAVVA